MSSDCLWMFEDLCGRERDSNPFLEVPRYVVGKDLTCAPPQ